MASSKRSWSLSSLPLVLIEEIFHRTPAESLARSKPACKEWYDLITNNKRFRYEHFRRSPQRTDERRFLRIDETVQIMDPVRRTRSSETRIPYELQTRHYIKAMVHCDGLMLCMCRDMESRIALWNPLTRDIKWIRPSKRFTTSDYYGIGYNKYQEDDYKILRFSNDQSWNRHHYHREADVEIYYCKTSSWRTLDDAKVDWSVDSPCRGVAVTGNMYWLARRMGEEMNLEYYILGFDFSVETFKDVCFCPPAYYDNNYLSCFDGDRLSLIQQDQDEKTSPIEVWVSSKLDDGNVLFTRYFTVSSPGLPALLFDRARASHPVYYIAENKRIIAWCEGEVEVDEGDRLPVCITLYEIDEGGVSSRLVTEEHYEDDYAGTFLCGYLYVPSLVPLPV
ncbi:putative F-box only protein 15 [Raphanus sativus]|uniref:F-box only protein 15 n=1 Tax=Raphanus sativus TaxID=3726 RepID=A0A6J0MCE0_RAPSA|nr:putative F-box only protein 15 [Raphanus sativus]KAJ4911136.1 putative F-box only protein 15 [Raphanus sativus]